MAGTVTFINNAGTASKTYDGSSVTGWVSSASVAVNTDNFLTGSSSISDKVSAATVYGYYNSSGPFNFSSGGGNEGEHIFVIMNGQGSVDTLANGGFGIICADDLATDSVGVWYVGPQSGSLGGWEYFVINPAQAFDAIVAAGSASWTTGGNPSQLTGVDGIGPRWKITNSVMGASDNAFTQTASVGLGYRITGTTSVTFADFSSYETTNRFGALQTKSGVLLPLCGLYVGAATGATNTTLVDSGFTIVWQGQANTSGTSAVAAGFYGLFAEQGTGATDITMSNASLSAASPTTFDLSLAGVTNVDIVNMSVDRARLVTLDSAVDWDGGIVKNSGQIDASGAIFTNVSVLTSTVAADTGALYWNDATDPSGNIDGCTFTKGTNAHHAIEFGTSTPNTVTLVGMAFGTSWNAAHGNNDSTLLFPDKGSDTTWTVNLSGCTGTITYKKARAGDTVNLVSSTTLQLTGLQNPTEVRVYDAGTTTEIAGQENVTTGTYSTGIDSATYPSVDISIISLGYQNLRLLSVDVTSNRSIPVVQQLDRQYLNP